METGVAARGGTRGWWLVLALVLLLRLPFLQQAIQGDDDIYRTEAEHALIDPLHPNDVKYVFLGDEVDLRGHSHPPLNAWALAGLIAVVGDIREVPFHAAYIVFSLIAAASMWALARRFSPQPLWASLLFLAVPAFVVNGGSFESDLPFLAWWMAAVALFCGGRLAWAAVALALAAMTAYQAIFLVPILALYVWLFRRRDQAAWAVVLVPVATIAAWQLFTRLTTGALPASMLAGYFSQYGFQQVAKKLASALMLFIHSWFIVFPALVPPTALLAWRRRREPETLFLLGWIALFFAGAVVVFFAGSARYLLPMAAPVALLASRLRVKWLAPAFALQLALGIGLAAVNYQHTNAYRDFAHELRAVTAGHRVWVAGEWGLRFYLEADGALPLRKTQQLRAGDVVVSSELAYPVEFTAPATPIAQREIAPALPLRLIALDSHSGYSTCDRGFWPFGISSGAIDRVRALMIVDRQPTDEYVMMNAADAATQLVSGIFALEQGRYRWIGKTAVIVLKSPVEPLPLRATFNIPPQVPARTVRLLLDGTEVAAKTYTAPGTYTLESAPVRAQGPTATMAIEVDRTYQAPGDSRKLGIVLSGAGFAR
jgi:4-amino-4-deoxy-L-arabinose transferase-like glycosyltransferase